MHDPRYVPKSSLARWLDSRLPILRFSREHIESYPTPRNLEVPPYAFLSDTRLKIG